MTTSGAPAATSSPGSTRRGHDAGRRRHDASASPRSCSSVAICGVGGGDAGARRVESPPAGRPPAAAADAGAGRRHAVVGGLQPRLRQLAGASPHRRAACASRRARSSSCSKRSSSALRGGQFGCGRLPVGARPRHLRLGLAHVLGARAGLQQPQLRVGLGALGLRALAARGRSSVVESVATGVAGRHALALRRRDSSTTRPAPWRRPARRSPRRSRSRAAASSLPSTACSRRAPASSDDGDEAPARRES